MESYDLAALYYARRVEIPKAINPIFIFIGDEKLYDFISKDAAKEWARTSLEGRTSVASVIGELKQKYSVYAVLKPYDVDHLMARVRQAVDRLAPCKECGRLNHE